MISLGGKKKKRHFFLKHDFSVEKRCLNYFDQASPNLCSPELPAATSSTVGVSRRSCREHCHWLSCMFRVPRHSVSVKDKCL